MVIVTMDEESRQRILDIEKTSRFPTGIGRIDRGECEIGSMPTSCTLCPYGHMLECHYPQTCEEAQCDHYKMEILGETE